MDEQEWDQAGADPDAYPPGIDPYPPEDFGPERHDQPTDQDQVSDHPYQPSEWGDICGQVVDGWPCGSSLSEHADQGRP